MLEELLRPDPEFTPIPFWFLNDALEEETLTRQLGDFKSKGVDAVLLHPRIGLPKTVGYLSDEFFYYIELCVRYARDNGMKIMLYDEGMYPSGSACGLVAARDPAFRSRALYEKDASALTLEEKENTVAYYAVQKDGAECRRIGENGAVGETERKTAYVCGYSMGRIRGIHADQDDGMPGAPLAGDILGRDAVRAFIEITHEAYYRRLSDYFGSTIIAFFTDEPSPFGRNPSVAGALPWTPELDFEGICLPALFSGRHQGAGKSKLRYEEKIRELLSENFYGQLSRWCEAHGIALTGHPHLSGDIEYEKHFHIPGQDIVWRMNGPEYNLDSPDSVYAKCASDAARHRGARRNSVEAFGVCGKKDNPWDFTASEMMWYLNYMFVRGTNMVLPHAFYYSVRTPLQFGERPPDVGPNSLWWKNYRLFSDYIKRMCRLNTGSVNTPRAAVLCSGGTMPYREVKPLYENGLEFNYLNLNADYALCAVGEGGLSIGEYRYDLILLHPSVFLNQEAKALLEQYRMAGGVLYTGTDFQKAVREHKKTAEGFDGNGKNLRVSHLRKQGMDFYLFANECNEEEQEICGVYTAEVVGEALRIDLFSGEMAPAECEFEGGTTRIGLRLAPYQCLLYAVDTKKPPKAAPAANRTKTARLALGRLDVSLFGAKTPLKRETEAELKTEPDKRYLLCFDRVEDLCSVTVDGREGPDLMLKPFRADITDLLDPERTSHTIQIQVFPSRANLYGTPIGCGVAGARLEVWSREG